MSRPRWIVATIVVGHFTASFSALGMPPFFPIILRDSLGSQATWLAGWCYVLPPLMTALSAPIWGDLSDRFGKKTMLLRAQLGLAGSFLLAGFATVARRSGRERASIRMRRDGRSGWDDCRSFGVLQGLIVAARQSAVVL